MAYWDLSPLKRGYLMCELSSKSSRKRSFIARALHWLYKTGISWLFGNACRFYPRCSDYALEAIEVHGWIRGAYLAFRRVLRCHPYNPGGIDPVP